MKKLLFLGLAILSNAQITKTAITFSRKVNTCDEWDRPLQNSTSKIIWSYNDNDPTGDSTIQYHGPKRGATSVRFFAPDTSLPHLPPDAQSFDITMGGVEITFNNPQMGPTSDYWCAGFKIDQFATKNQIIRVEPVIDPKNIQQVHHIVLYQCDGELTEEDMAYRGSCFTANMPNSIYSCNGAKMLHVWAVGGTPFDYPSHVGYPIGPNATYVVMQMHYENPTMVKVIDNSGLRFWTISQNLRTYDASVSIYGHTTSSVFSIPPLTSSYWVNAWCPSECTQHNLPAEGMKILAAALHTHTAGVSLKLQQFRNGTELPPPADEPYYDFNYQDYIIFSPELVVLPGDELYISCRYDTSQRTAPTYFGLSTDEEMCLIYFVYYPALSNEFEHCYYGDYTNITNPRYDGATAYCSSDLVIQNYTAKNFTPYVPPPCVYTAPPANRTAVTVSKSLINPADYERSQFLDPDQKYKLYWTIDVPNMAFKGAVEVETTGWIGLGISEYGMEGADVFIGWVTDDEQQVYFKDRFATRKALPPIDANQDFYDVSGAQVTIYPEESKLTTGQIAAIGAVSGAVFVLIIVGIVYAIRRNNRKYGYIGTDEEDTVFVSTKGDAVKL